LSKNKFIIPSSLITAYTILREWEDGDNGSDIALKYLMSYRTSNYYLSFLYDHGFLQKVHRRRAYFVNPIKKPKSFQEFLNFAGLHTSSVKRFNCLNATKKYLLERGHKTYSLNREPKKGWKKNRNRATYRETLRWLNHLSEEGFKQFLFLELPRHLKKINCLMRAQWEDWIQPVGKVLHGTSYRILWEIKEEVLK